MKAKVYTKGGDKGETSLVGGTRVSKAHSRIEVYGTLDELNSVLGIISARTPELKSGAFPDELTRRLMSVQNNLFNLGSQLACEDSNLLSQLPSANPTLVSQLEGDMDRWEAELPPLKNFVLPGGSELASFAHLARTICRRAERQAVRLRSETEIDGNVIIFLNRLSDWLFTLSRKLNSVAGFQDVEWSKD
jgi:cob(I)alamin adenosyltransferase